MMETKIDWGECSNDGCDYVCPMDMAGIIIFDEIYCTPECAKAGLEDMPDEPREVVLHDPQLVVDREELNMDGNTIDIRHVGPEPPAEKIEHCADLYDATFRVDMSELEY